jgi:hypothetical protein
MSNTVDVCVTGDGVVGKSQRVSFAPSASLASSLRRLATALQLDPPDATIKSVAVYDRDFDEYVLADSLERLADKSKLRIELTGGVKPLPADALRQVLEQADRAVLNIVERGAGGGLAAEVRERQAATRAIMAAVAAGSMSADAAADAVAAHAKLPAQTTSPARTPLARTPEVRAAKPSAAVPSAAAALHDSYSAKDDMLAERRNKSAAPSRMKAAPPMQEEALAAETPTRGEMVRADSPSSRSVRRHVHTPVSPHRPSSAKPPTIARASSPTTGLAGSNEITVFCVYNGATTQRAKAIRVRRQSPDLDGILRTLKEKFNTELCLGYVEIDTGAFVELLDATHLAEIIANDCREGDSLTLQCWRPEGLGDVDTQSNAATTPGKRDFRSNSRQLTLARLAGSQGAQSVGSRMDVSGAMYSNEQLRDLFEDLDADGSGFLDVNEFRAYFRATYDDMGITDADAKFEKMIANAPGFEDGKLDFDEFALIMLKLSQW